jgi:hypothetical protein
MPRTNFIIKGKNLNAECCMILAIAHLPQLKELFLKFNQLGSKGCQHLITASWPNLTQLDLSNQ